MSQIAAEPMGAGALSERTRSMAFTSAMSEIIWAAIALTLIASMGALKLLTPLDGDQALFLYFAEAIDHGERLYVDIWDMKQPGIFWFYWLGGKIFGFSELSVKLLELGWLLAFAVCLILCLRRSFMHRWLSSVVAIAALGSYYTFASSRELTQCEILLSFPMFLAAWLLLRDSRSSAAGAIFRGLAGASAGVAVVFKLFYAPVFIAFVLVAIFVTRPTGTPRPSVFRHGLTVLWPFTLGVAFVLGAASLILWRQGVLDELLWNSFVYPFHALGTAADSVDVGRLVRNFSWMLASMGPWLLFAIVAVARVNNRDEPAIMRQMLAWLVVASLLIALQSLMFWKYHFLLLFVPIAVLAARGIDVLLLRLSAPRRSRWLSSAALAMFLTLPAMGAIGHAAQRQAEQFHVVALGSGHLDIESYRSAIGREYGWIREHFLSLRDPAGGEPIYVFGNPLIYLVTERRQAIPINGWSWEAYPSELWAALPNMLMAARPAYVFVDHVAVKLIPEMSPATQRFIDTDYDPVLNLDKGRLYARRSPPPDQQPDLGWRPGL